ncbi:hypothetical protein GF1_21210 [Desulfolithobacter dissulfuricans]|uniref:Sulfotransferase n=1 Tax=Desulfolithobacter dissulfuricans TaxID=2795293 RepID=A0A915XIZ9_9BACT|nr:sulfotransferase [Desulfolithobacter dissulfuricans]BCO09745.1 hypothetical protein GF1_21210 [Desulfolithobacter dissulfuricans]
MIAQVDKTYIRTRPWKLWSRMVSYALFEGRPLTTRGRWVNPIVFAHFAVEKRLTQLKRVEKPVFILGTGRSGTTILGVVLSMHREVGFLNEPKALWHAIHPEEDLIGSYTRGTARYRIGAEEATLEVKKSAHRLFGAYLAATISRRVVDKYPELIFRVPFVKAIFPDAKFLFLSRNGWDTCHSIDGWSHRLGQQVGGENHDWWGVDRRKWDLLVDQIVPEHADLALHADAMRTWTNHTDMAAVEWVVTMREGLSLLQQYPNDVLQVSYEKLCAKPLQVLGEITPFTGLAGSDMPFIRYAESTLKPVGQKKPFALAPAIEKPFCEVMQKLGYEASL